MGDPGRRDHLASLDPLPTGGQEVDSAPPWLSATWQIATTWSIKEQFLSSLGHTCSVLGPPICDGQTLKPCIRTCLDTDTLSSSRSDAKVLSLSQLDACWQLMFPHPLVAHVTDPADKARCVVTGRFHTSYHSTFHSAQLQEPAQGTSNMVPLRPLAGYLDAWLIFSNHFPDCSSEPFGAAMQFSSPGGLPKFRGILFTSVQGENAALLRAEVATLLKKGAIEPVPLAEMKKGLYPRRTDPGFEDSEPGPSQASIQNANLQAHINMWQRSGLVCGNRPEGCILSCLNPTKAQAISFGLSSKDRHISIKSFPSGCPCLLVSLRRSQRLPLPSQGSGNLHSQLS